VRIGVGVYTQMNRNYKHVGGRDIESCGEGYVLIF